jgi:hypothetical protein
LGINQTKKYKDAKSEYPAVTISVGKVKGAGCDENIRKIRQSRTFKKLANDSE